MDNKTTAELKILLGHEEIEVDHRDGSKEIIEVKEISMRKIERVGRAISIDEAEEIKVYTGKTDDWIDSLVPDSFVKVLKKGRELARNFTNGTEWLKRRTDLMTALVDGPGVDKLVKSALKQVEEKERQLASEQ